MWWNDIIAIINNNGENASPWNILLWIFISAKVFPLAVNSTRIPSEFLTPKVASGFSLEFEWKQVSSGIQDSS